MVNMLIIEFKLGKGVRGIEKRVGLMDWRVWKDWGIVGVVLFKGMNCKYSGW